MQMMPDTNGGVVPSFLVLLDSYILYSSSSSLTLPKAILSRMRFSIPMIIAGVTTNANIFYQQAGKISLWARSLPEKWLSLRKNKARLFGKYPTSVKQSVDTYVVSRLLSTGKVESLTHRGCVCARRGAYVKSISTCVFWW